MGFTLKSLPDIQKTFAEKSAEYLETHKVTELKDLPNKSRVKEWQFLGQMIQAMESSTIESEKAAKIITAAVIDVIESMTTTAFEPTSKQAFETVIGKGADNTPDAAEQQVLVRELCLYFKHSCFEKGCTQLRENIHTEKQDTSYLIDSYERASTKLAEFEAVDRKAAFKNLREVEAAKNPSSRGGWGIFGKQEKASPAAKANSSSELDNAREETAAPV